MKQGERGQEGPNPEHKKGSPEGAFRHPKLESAQTQLRENYETYSKSEIELTKDEKELSESDLAEMISKEESLVSQKEAKIQSHENEFRHYESNRHRTSLTLQTFQGYQQRVDSQLNVYQDLFNEVSQTGDWIAHWETPRDDDIETLINNYESDLIQGRQQYSEITANRTAAIESIYQWLNDPQFEHLQLDLLRNLKAWGSDDFERGCVSLIDELELREDMIQDDLAETEKHRELIIKEALIAAENGIRLLKAAAVSSKLPDETRGLAGQPFLNISERMPKSPAECRERISALVDNIIQSGEIPKSLEFMQRAVRKLGHPIQVEVLFPDVDGQAHYVPIYKMPTESGGERLTSAVLLYCTLARLRARERGREVPASNSLILDNPQGTVSRPKFLALQREVARAMNIQLIYATGVNDDEAIRIMPNVIRLRNERRDRKTGDCMLEVARIVFPEDHVGKEDE